MAIFIADQVLTAVISRLSDSTSGFNATLQTAATDHGVDPFSIDFDSERSTNFLIGYWSIANIDETGNQTYPLVAVYVVDESEGPTPFTKFHLFSGTVVIGIDVHLSYSQDHPPRDTEKLSSAVARTIIDILNRDQNQNWGNEISYNGNIECHRTPISYGANNWLKTLNCRAVFQVDIFPQF